MITTDLGAAYAPQTVISKSTLTYKLPLAPVAPRVPSPSLPSARSGPVDAYARQPAPVTPAITTPESADVMQPTKTYTLPNYGYATPEVAPNPYGAAKPTAIDYYPGYAPGATATEATVEMPQETTPEGSIDASLATQAASTTEPWYMNKTYWLIGGVALVGILLLRRK